MKLCCNFVNPARWAKKIAWHNITEAAAEQFHYRHRQNISKMCLLFSMLDLCIDAA